MWWVEALTWNHTVAAFVKATLDLHHDSRHNFCGHVAQLLADNDDNRVLEAAIAARAEAIVTGDAETLSLGPGWQGIQIVKPADFLALIQDETAGKLSLAYPHEIARSPQN